MVLGCRRGATALTEQERARGLARGALLREARAVRPVREVAAAAGLAEETVRKTERGAAPTPALSTVAALADTLDQLVRLARVDSAAGQAAPAAVA